MGKVERAAEEEGDAVDDGGKVQVQNETRADSNVARDASVPFPYHVPSSSGKEVVVAGQGDAAVDADGRRKEDQSS